MHDGSVTQSKITYYVSSVNFRNAILNKWHNALVGNQDYINNKVTLSQDDKAIYLIFDDDVSHETRMIINDEVLGD